MRRTLFNLTIALLAFGIGLVVVLNFYWKKDARQNLSVEQAKVEKITENNDVEKISVQTEEDKLINDRIDAFFPTIGLWMKDKKIDEYVEAESDGLRGRTRLLDIDNDRTKELAIQTNCSAVGNCELWMYQKYMDGFNVILKTGMVQTFELKKTKTNGSFDLETKSHDDAFSGEINIYKFDSKEYKVSECSDYTYSELKNGELIKIKNPKITQRNCSEKIKN